MAARPQPSEVPEVEVKSRELGSLTELDPACLDKHYTYRWVHKSPLKVARAKARGYRIVDPANEEIRNAVGESPEAADGTYTLGDVILMRIKRDEYRARRKTQKRKTDKRLKGPVRKFRRTAQERGALRGQHIEVITDNKDPEGKED